MSKAMALRRVDRDGEGGDKQGEVTAMTRVATICGGEERPSGVMRGKGAEMLSIAMAMTRVAAICKGNDVPGRVMQWH